MLPQATVRRTQRVAEIIRNSDALSGLAGFVIDSPHPDDSCPGNGIEINGWAIGKHAPVDQLTAIVDDDTKIQAAIDVRRPDVLGDYPGFPWAAQSGFSFWVPIPVGKKQWSIELKAVLSDGGEFHIARLIGHGVDTELPSDCGVRVVSSPDYIILGTQRGGTTSLFRYLGAHPDVHHPRTKELHYLTDRYHRGASWYQGQFPETLRPGEMTGEATPYALFHPRAPARAKEVAPDARLIVLLRDPVERAFSHYQHELSIGAETLSFSDAVAAESSRLEGESSRLQSDPDYVSFNHKHFSYLSRGDYAAQLNRWLDHFPRDQFLILRSEDLYSKPGSTMQRVLSFLGLRVVDLGPFDIYNQSAESTWDETMRKGLREHFEPINKGLHGLVEWPILWPVSGQGKFRLPEWA